MKVPHHPIHQEEWIQHCCPHSVGVEIRIHRDLSERRGGVRLIIVRVLPIKMMSNYNIKQTYQNCNIQRRGFETKHVAMMVQTFR